MRLCNRCSDRHDGPSSVMQRLVLHLLVQLCDRLAINHVIDAANNCAIDLTIKNAIDATVMRRIIGGGIDATIHAAIMRRLMRRLMH